MQPAGEPQAGEARASEPQAAQGEPAQAEAQAAQAQPASQTETPAPPPKVVVVIVGDADPELRAAASRVEASLAASPRLRLPADPRLRGALLGEEGASDDGLAEVRAERRRLGLSEASDVPVLATLGRRAGAVAVVVVRASPAPALVVLDVANGAFFDGELGLAAAGDEQIAIFVARRARASSRGAAGPEAASGASAPEAATEPDPERPREPDFFERYWPYGVAALLLGAMITAIAVTSATAGQSPPVLHFRPGGR